MTCCADLTDEGRLGTRVVKMGEAAGFPIVRSGSGSKQDR
jgi:hypothetical protein